MTSGYSFPRLHQWGHSSCRAIFSTQLALPLGPGDCDCPLTLQI